MVRNSASMQSLRDSLVDCTVAPSTELPSHPPTVPLQSLTGLSVVQLCGDDAYTKALMSRVATGAATGEEQEEFKRHVAKARSLPSLRSIAKSASSPVSSAETEPAPVAESDIRQDSNTRVRGESGVSPSSRTDPEHGSRSVKDTLRSSLGPVDTELGYPSQDEVKRLVLLRKEQEEMKFGTPESTWERKRTRLLEVHSDNWMPNERFQFQKLWKKHSENHAKQVRFALRSNALNARIAAAYSTAPGGNRSQTTPFKMATRENAAKYTQPFCTFMSDNPTVFHAVSELKTQLKYAGFSPLSERETWDLKPGQGYYIDRNGSSLIAFSVGANYKPGNGAAIVAGHVDAVTAKLKPISQLPTRAGYVQLGVAPYAGGLNSTWWDRDLAIGGRILLKEDGKIVTKLIKLDWPIARVPTLAPHFGVSGPFNKETRMVPIVGLEGTDARSDTNDADGFQSPPLLGGLSNHVGSFVNTQPPALVNAIARQLGLHTSEHMNIVNWELELYDCQPATAGGLNLEFIYAGRLDDKLCSWAAMQALIESHEGDVENSSLIKIAGVFDDEEIGSLLRQGAGGNFLPMTMERVVSSLSGSPAGPNLMGQTYANSFLVSSDVTHAANPNFLDVYLANHAPHLNVGVAVSADSNGHMTTDAVSTAILKRCADRVGANLQVFQIRNDSRSGGTIGPMLSAMTGIRAVDAGIPQLSMHSIRATTGALDPGLGVITFLAFFNGFEEVDKEVVS